MKKFLHPKILPILVPLCGLLGLVLRIWTIGDGPDQDGLYAPQPLAWTLLWILTGLTLLGILLIPRKLKNPGKYADNFPASPVAAAGSGLAAFVVLFSGMKLLIAGAAGLTVFTAITAILSGVCLMIAAVNRFQGQKPQFLLHAVPCVYFALRLFECCRQWSNEPQLTVFLLPFLASICVMLASYQYASFDVNLGRRRPFLFWSLSGVYFCLVSLPLCDDPLFYGAMVLWLITNLCCLRPLGKRKPQPEPVQEENPAAESPDVPAEDTPAEETSTAEKSAEDMSMDELMNWLENK